MIGHRSQIRQSPAVCMVFNGDGSRTTVAGSERAPAVAGNQPLMQRHRSSCAVAWRSVLLLVGCMLEQHLQPFDMRARQQPYFGVWYADGHIACVVGGFQGIAFLPHIRYDAVAAKMNCSSSQRASLMCAVQRRSCAHGNHQCGCEMP